MINVLEIIDVRSGSIKSKEVTAVLDQLVQSFSQNSDSEKIKIYTHFHYSTDFSLHLFYKIADRDHLNNQLGMRLASSLKEYGLVNHSVWIESEYINLRRD
jgi:hypothetical protein